MIDLEQVGKLQADCFSFIECKNCSGMQAKKNCHNQRQACQRCIVLNFLMHIAYGSLVEHNVLSSSYVVEVGQILFLDTQVSLAPTHVKVGK